MTSTPSSSITGPGTASPDERGSDPSAAFDQARARARVKTGRCGAGAPAGQGSGDSALARPLCGSRGRRPSGRSLERKGDAIAHTATLVAQLGQDGRRSQRVPTLTGFLEEWPRRFPRHPRTQATNSERIQRYLLPLLPNQGELPLDELRRADLRAAQDTLLRRRLAKTTIDGAFSALSALMRDAIDIELIDRPDESPVGAGEAAHSPIPGAIANAIFDATGVRIRRVPLTPEAVLAGLRA